MLLIVICCAWIFGIFLGAFCHWPLALILIGLIPVPLAFLPGKHRKSLVVVAICLITFFSADYFSGTVPVQSQISREIGQTNIELKGVINTPVENKDNTARIALTVLEIKSPSWHIVHEDILVFVPRFPEYKYGDILLLQGNLEFPPEFDDFNYQSYLTNEGIFAVMFNPKVEIAERGTGSKPLAWIYALRSRLSENLSVSLPEPQASLAQGIILGIRTTIPDNLKSNLSVTGTAHLLAISGINLSIVAGLLVALGIWMFGRRHYFYVWLALLMVWFYSLITGMQAPVIRSAIMASLFLFAELLGRQKNLFPALIFSAAIMAGFSPRILWSSSFQLSFLAMIGLIFIAPPLQSLFRKVVAARFDENGFPARSITLVSDSFIITFSAILAVWPVIAYNFGVISLVGPLTTFLIAPVLTPIIILGSVSAVLGFWSPQLSQIVGWTAWLFLSYMLGVVNNFAAIPSVSLNTGTIDLRLIWIYYTIVGLAIVCKSHSKKILNPISTLKYKLNVLSVQAYAVFQRTPRKWIILPLMIPAFLTSLAAASMPDDNLHVSFLDVGEGDAIFIQVCNQNILIDGGPSPQSICLNLGERMPFWDRNLDLVILTHPHLDHLSGLVEVLKRFNVNQVMAPDLSYTSPVYSEWLNLIRMKNIQFTCARSGQQISLAKGSKLTVLNPPDSPLGKSENDLENLGIVSRLTLNKVSFLFTADIGQEAETRLVNHQDTLTCTVLKVAHHGSASSTSPDFIAASAPQIAVISAGADNQFGHPNEEVLRNLKNQTIYRTDKSGSIDFTTDGIRLWVKTSKGLH